VCQTVIEPTLRAMESEGCPYHGILYVGLMLTKQGPKVVEFNCRLGDPETQCVLPVLESDLVDLALAAVQGRLGEVHVPTPRKASAVVVIAAEGYPGTIRKGRRIIGIEEAERVEGVRVLHSGTSLDPDNQLVTSGGRVLCVVGLGDDLPQAVERAYAGVSELHIEGAQWRTDIAARGLAALAPK